MTLGELIRQAQDAALVDLAAAHDYYEDTKFAWGFVEGAVLTGRKFSNVNLATGTVTSEIELVRKSPGYVNQQLAEATFQQFLAIFENFILDLLRLWLTAYPRSLGKKTIDFRTVLDAPDRDTIIQQMIRKELNEVLYDRPAGWFAYLEEKAKLGCPTTDEIERISESKAARDVLIHNKGIVNQTYLLKAGQQARFQEGDRLEITERYHRITWELIRKLVAEIAAAAVAKVP